MGDSRGERQRSAYGMRLRSLGHLRELAFWGDSVGEACSMVMEEVFAEVFCFLDFAGVAG